jgi:hypothetical protein
LTVTYAGYEGDIGPLEGMYRRGLNLPKIGPDLHAGDGLLMFWTHEPVAPWQDAAWLAQMRGQLRPNAYLRLIENRYPRGSRWPISGQQHRRYGDQSSARVKAPGWIRFLAARQAA